MQSAALGVLCWAQTRVLPREAIFAAKMLKSPNSAVVYPNGFAPTVFWKKKIRERKAVCLLTSVSPCLQSFVPILLLPDGLKSPSVSGIFSL